MSRALYVGLMSGTSMDGIDCALVSIHGDTIEFIDANCLQYPDSLLEDLQRLIRHPSISLFELGKLNQGIAVQFAKSVNNLLEKNQLSASDINAIGSHGQTVFHSPPSVNNNALDAFSMQLGDASMLAALTGIDVVADFRQADIAAGGEGAPLTPAFHQALFKHKNNIGVLNLGGIANISIISDEKLIAFDTGPASTLMDAWIKKHLNQSYDGNGAWAKSGTINIGLLHTLLAHDYFKQAAPKSTGFETFNLNWLEELLSDSPEPLTPEDIQATLLAFTVETIADAISPYPIESCYVCGGGVHNAFLMDSLKQKLECSVHSTNELGANPDWVEAMCFAWLAHQHIKGKTGNEPSVTGAKKRVILGGLYPSN